MALGAGRNCRISMLAGKGLPLCSASPKTTNCMTVGEAVKILDQDHPLLGSIKRCLWAK
jgi:hypothetical protein